jgi:thiol-disulfide isomerase/thioredoxin
MNRRLLTVFTTLLLVPGFIFAADSTGGGPARQTIPATPLKPMPQAKGAAQDKVATLQPGSKAPDFVAKDLAGKEVRLSDYRDKVVVLDFWATWCGPCKASLPHTQEVAKSGKAQGLVVLANCTSDTRAEFQKFMAANRPKYPDVVFTCDPHEKGSATFAERASRSLYGVTGIPTQFVIGRDGTIAAVLVGYSQGDHRLEQALGKLGVQVTTE